MLREAPGDNLGHTRKGKQGERLREQCSWATTESLESGVCHRECQKPSSCERLKDGEMDLGSPSPQRLPPSRLVLVYIQPRQGLSYAS